MTANENPKNKNTENMSPEEKQRMHDNYSAMGHKGGQKGGEARKEQMAHSSSYTTKEEENKENK